MHAEIFDQIDAALGGGVAKDGLSAYADILQKFERKAKANSREAMQYLYRAFCRFAARRYLNTLIDRHVSLWTFNDGANECLFDETNERTILLYGLTKSVAQNSRDATYHKGFPAMPRSLQAATERSDWPIEVEYTLVNGRQQFRSVIFSNVGDSFDKGHMLSHAQGGIEGGPGYFPQDRSVNQRRSSAGHLWRDIETYFAANSGLPAFVRLIYPPQRGLL